MVRHLLGRPGGPAVMLVHGIGMSSRCFRPLARQLSATGRVLAVDLPGHGSSPRRSMGCQVVAELARHGAHHSRPGAGARLCGELAGR